MGAKLGVAVLMAVLVFYCVMVSLQAVILFQEGGIGRVLFGIGLLITVVLAVGLSLREIQFGRHTARLGQALAEEGGLPQDDLPRRPSGRIDRKAADTVFEQYRTETEADPDNWRSWYRLALAYESAGDRTRARAAARHAIRLF